jgi:hypothetical protein
MEGQLPKYDDVKIAVADDQNLPLITAKYKVVKTTLSGTKYWFFFNALTLLLSIVATIVVVSISDMDKTEMSLFAINFLFVCMTSIFVSKTIRDVQEASTVEEFAKNTSLYNNAYIQSLKGQPLWHYIVWAGFAVSILTTILAISFLGGQDRAMLFICALLLYTNTFFMSKTVRDRNDAAKW